MLNDSIRNKPLNILKASLPFMTSPMQKAISYYIKIEEFQSMCNSINEPLDNDFSACDFNSESRANPYEFINAIKPYLNTEEKNLIEMFINMVNAFNMYGTYKTLSEMPFGDIANFTSSEENSQKNNSTNEETSKQPFEGNNFNVDALKNMLSPSQKAMFETYSSLLNNNKSK